MESAIQASGLTRTFGKRNAVEDLSFEVRTGTITGFLGPNGAGKTTTIRMLLGLARPDRGSARTLGHPAGHPLALAQTGALVESPSLYDHLTGKENLEITRLMRDLPRSEVDRVLGLVDMARDARRPVREYSLGMRQRMAVALALMGNPSLLILDEPSNGLDPNGIQEMRELIKGLPRAMGATIFLSSHLLAEVEQIATEVVVIHQGRLRYQGPIQDLGAPGAPRLLVRVDDPALGLTRLAALGTPATAREDGLLEVETGAEGAPGVARALVEGGLALYEITPCHANLEARFLALLESA